MATLAVNDVANVYYEQNGSTNQVAGTVITLAAGYIEVQNASGTNISVPWGRVTEVIS